MTVKARSADSLSLAVGQQWIIDVSVYDVDGAATEDTLTVTVTDPNGDATTPTVETTTTGYRAVVTVTVPGRWVAVAASAANGMHPFVADVAEISTAANMPSIADLDDYLGTHSATDAQLDDALQAETAAQVRACRMPAAYTADLRQALLRRCARNLAMRRIPLAVLQGDSDSGPTVPPGRDPEVRRFEHPYRKLPTG